MTHSHLVRIGAMGNVGRFASAGGARFPRGARVVCRTERGLEVGEVLSQEASGESDGSLLRAVSTEDDLLLARIGRNRNRALAACEKLLAERRLDAVLLDAEQLFDGRSLYFYFLGEVPPEVDALTAELAEAYEAKVRFREFTEAVIAGCGPACGTEESTGCGSSGCSTCAVAAACKT